MNSRLRPIISQNTQKHYEAKRSKIILIFDTFEFYNYIDILLLFRKIGSTGCQVGIVRNIPECKIARLFLKTFHKRDFFIPSVTQKTMTTYFVE